MNRRHALAAALVLLPAALPAAASASGAEKKKGGGASYIQIQTLTASVIRRNGSRGVMTMETGVDVADEALRLRAFESVPRLRAGFTQILQIYASGLPAAGTCFSAAAWMTISTPRRARVRRERSRTSPRKNRIRA